MIVRDAYVIISNLSVSTTSTKKTVYHNPSVVSTELFNTFPKTVTVSKTKIAFDRDGIVNNRLTAIFLPLLHRRYTRTYISRYIR